MSITEKDIEKLASLSRIRISDEEKTQFAKEIDSILGYVEQIKEVSENADVPKTPDSIPHRNALREDADDRNLNADGSALITAAPASQDGLIKVKKILN